MEKNIKSVLNLIEQNGFEAYIVGGYVRDHLLGIPSTDIDICTNALPKDLAQIFKGNLNNAANYGSFKIQTDKYTYAITTYRKEQKYQKRKPTQVEYINNLIEDLQRRDFTINTICMNKEGDIIDLMHGRQDLQKRLIKCIGSPKEKLTEDPLRILRAVRFSITLNFKLDNDLKKAIIQNKHLINTLSYTRKRQELDRILVSPHVKEGLKLLESLGLLQLLEINYSNLTPINDLCAMYSQITISEKYPFTKNELNLINSLKKILKEKTVNSKTIFKYGLYLNNLAGKILGIDPKTINDTHHNLPITTEKDLAISPKTICTLLNQKPSRIIKDIQSELINKILERKIPNEEEQLIEYITTNKWRWLNDRD